MIVNNKIQLKTQYPEQFWLNSVLVKYILLF